MVTHVLRTGAITFVVGIAIAVISVVFPILPGVGTGSASGLIDPPVPTRFRRDIYGRANP